MFRTFPRSLGRSFARALLIGGLAVGAVSVSGTFSSMARADAPAAASPTSFLQGKQQKVRTLLATPASPEREKKIDAELAQLVDYEEMGKVALGEHWNKRSKAELDEFVGILKQLIEKSYKKRLNQTLDYDIAYKGEEPKGSDVLVKTEAKNLKNKHEAPVLLDYVVRKVGSGFIVVDLIPEGSSMAKTYNKEFTKVIKKDGWETLIKKMKDKLAKS